MKTMLNDVGKHCYHYLLSLLQQHRYQYEAIRQVHSHFITTGGLYSDQYPAQTQITAATIWSTLIRYYSLCPFPEKAIFLYKYTQQRHTLQLQLPVLSDSFIYSFLLKACANLGRPSIGSQLHGHSLKAGFGYHVYVQTALINMYLDCRFLVRGKKVFDEMPHRNAVSWNVLITGLAKWGELGLARFFFDAMPIKNVVSWTGLIDGYTRTSHHMEALSLFRTMFVHEGIKPTGISILTIIPAVWNIGYINFCQVLHVYAEKSGIIATDIRVTNSFIDAYAKCGHLESALRVFEDIADERKNLVSWTSMISGFAMHGRGKEAVNNFKRMETLHMMPNRVTFLSVLNACSHGGLVMEGIEFFMKMINEYGILPTIKHYGCVIDMLGREGRLEEAEKIALSIPAEISNVVIWRTLLGACSLHGNSEIGERVTKKIMEMEGSYGGDYVLLSNIFAGACRFADSERVRREMDGRNASKVPGFSLV